MNIWLKDNVHPGELIPQLVRQQIKMEPSSILDCGGGGGTVGGDWGGGKFIAVLDVFQPTTHIPPNFTLGSGLDAVEIYGEKSFDVVMACEVIEHLEFADGPKLLAALEKVAKKIVILTTPHGFQKQDPNDPANANEPWINNKYQLHLSGWCHTDLEKLGYTVLFNGGMNVEGEAAQLVAWKVLDVV